jgi:hypothetical protein
MKQTKFFVAAFRHNSKFVGFLQRIKIAAEQGTRRRFQCSNAPFTWIQFHHPEFPSHFRPLGLGHHACHTCHSLASRPPSTLLQHSSPELNGWLTGGEGGFHLKVGALRVRIRGNCATLVTSQQRRKIWYCIRLGTCFLTTSISVILSFLPLPHVIRYLAHWFFSLSATAACLRPIDHNLSCDDDGQPADECVCVGRCGIPPTAYRTINRLGTKEIS